MPRFDYLEKDLGYPLTFATLIDVHTSRIERAIGIFWVVPNHFI